MPDAHNRKPMSASLLANLTQSLQRYSEEDVLVDHEYSDMVFDEADGVRLDSSRLDVTQPMAETR